MRVRGLAAGARSAPFCLRASGSGLVSWPSADPAVSPPSLSTRTSSCGVSVPLALAAREHGVGSLMGPNSPAGPHGSLQSASGPCAAGRLAASRPLFATTTRPWTLSGLRPRGCRLGVPGAVRVALALPAPSPGQALDLASPLLLALLCMSDEQTASEGHLLNSWCLTEPHPPPAPCPPFGGSPVRVSPGRPWAPAASRHGAGPWSCSPPLGGPQSASLHLPPVVFRAPVADSGPDGPGLTFHQDFQTRQVSLRVT